jgi:hypothetical protein
MQETIYGNWISNKLWKTTYLTCSCFKQASIQVESEFRILVDKRYVKYLTIDTGLFEINERAFGPTLFSLLPPFPVNDWNKGRISKDPVTGAVCFSAVSRAHLPGVGHLAYHSYRPSASPEGPKTSFQRLRGHLLSLQLASCCRIRPVPLGSASTRSRVNSVPVDRRPTDWTKLSWPSNGGGSSNWDCYGPNCKLSSCHARRLRSVSSGFVETTSHRDQTRWYQQAQLSCSCWRSNAY